MCGKLLQRYPPIGSYKLERVQRVTSFLDGLGVDVKCAVKKYYWVLTGKVEKYEAVVQLLKANKIDVARVVNRTPNILFMDLFNPGLNPPQKGFKE